MLRLTEYQEVMDISEARGLKDQIIKLIHGVKDDKELVSVKNALLRKYVDERLQLLDDKTSWFEGGAKTLVTNLIISSQQDIRHKIAFIDFLLNDNQKFAAEDFTQKMSKRPLISLIKSRAIRRNPLFREIAPSILRFSEQSASGVGKGELFLLMFGKNSRKPSSRGEGAKGDVIIDGWAMEVKDSGGNIHAGKEEGLAKASEVFSYNQTMLQDAVKDKFPDEWIDPKDGKKTKADYTQFRLTPGQASTRGGDWFWRYLTNDIPGAKWQLRTTAAKTILRDYLMRVYYTMKRPDATRMAREMYPALGDKKKMQKVMADHLGAWVFDSYKSVEKYDSLLVLDLKKYQFANIVDGDDMPRGVEIGIPQISKGKSTYAVPAGAVNIKLK